MIMNRITIESPRRPAAMLSFTDSAPSVEPTCWTLSTCRSTGSEPALMPVARSVAADWVNPFPPPLITALPPRIACCVTASTSSLGQILPGPAVARQPVS